MIIIKEEFYSHDKAKRAYREGGAEALLLWHQLKAHAASKGTNGFIADESIRNFPLPPRNKTKSLRALVNCGELYPDGTRGPGLLEEVPHGWQLHDYLDHSWGSDELEERRQRDRERKQAQRDRSRLRVLLMAEGLDSVTADRTVREMDRSRVMSEIESRDMSRDMSQPSPVTEDRTVTGLSQCDPRAPVRARARAPLRDPTQPNPTQPNPAQPNPALHCIAPRNLEEALTMPIRARSAFLCENEHKAMWLEPQKWPELCDFAARISAACGWGEPRFTSGRVDRGVMALVHVLAAYDSEELERALLAAPKDRFLTSQRAGLGSLSLEVFRRLLNTNPNVSPDAAGQPDYEGEERETFAAYRQN